MLPSGGQQNTVAVRKFLGADWLPIFQKNAPIFTLFPANRRTTFPRLFPLAKLFGHAKLQGCKITFGGGFRGPFSKARSANIRAAVVFGRGGQMPQHTGGLGGGGVAPGEAAGSVQCHRRVGGRQGLRARAGARPASVCFDGLEGSPNRPLIAGLCGTVPVRTVPDCDPRAAGHCFLELISKTHPPTPLGRHTRITSDTPLPPATAPRKEQIPRRRRKSDLKIVAPRNSGKAVGGVDPPRTESGQGCPPHPQGFGDTHPWM